MYLASFLLRFTFIEQVLLDLQALLPNVMAISLMCNTCHSKTHFFPELTAGYFGQYSEKGSNWWNGQYGFGFRPRLFYHHRANSHSGPSRPPVLLVPQNIGSEVKRAGQLSSLRRPKDSVGCGSRLAPLRSLNYRALCSIPAVCIIHSCCFVNL
jgi:hypothetical protein